jgi:tRNA threonylcarbamoyladenosine biosynthesis protein TsaB
MDAATLALDGSTERGTAALADASGVVLWRAEFPAGRGHGGELFSALETGLKVLSGEKLGEIVVGLGPGSYSGVRQIIAAATGLSLSTGARLTGVPSPVALETAARAFHAVGDARRGTFYYTAVENGVCVIEPELLEAETLLARLAERPGWPVLSDSPLPGLADVKTTVALPLAERLLTTRPAARKVSELEPIYLRGPSITLPKPRS